MLAVTILAIISAAVSGALSAGRQQARTANQLLYARMHAEALMAEVLRLSPSSDTSKTTATSGVTRQSATDIQDYISYSDGPTGLKDINGVAYPAAMQGYTRKVSVTRSTSAVSYKNMSLPSPCVVTVTISRDGGAMVTLMRLVPG